jgi:hypothetical protein
MTKQEQEQALAEFDKGNPELAFAILRREREESRQWDWARKRGWLD